MGSCVCTVHMQFSIDLETNIILHRLLYNMSGPAASSMGPNPGHMSRSRIQKTPKSDTESHGPSMPYPVHKDMLHSPEAMALCSVSFPFSSKIFKIVIPPISHLTRILLSPLLLIRIEVKTLGIRRISHRWYNRPPILPMVNLIPQHAPEERVALDSCCSARDVT